MAMIFQKPLEKIELIDIQDLIKNQVEENIQMEYKRDLNLEKNKEKKEFLKDITGFANSEVGIIIYGIEEDRKSFPKEIPGIKIDNKDEFERYGNSEHVVISYQKSHYFRDYS